jgi:hypothetical protein
MKDGTAPWGVCPTRNFLNPALDAAASILRHCPPDLFPMRPHQVILPETNRLGPRLPPEGIGAAGAGNASARAPDDLDAVAVKVELYGPVGRNFKARVHVLAPGLNRSGNHMALRTEMMKPPDCNTRFS